MVQDTIGNAILIIAAVIATAVVLNAFYPAMFNMAGSIRSSVSSADDRSSTSVTISYCSFDQDDHQLLIWAKNSGREPITASEIAGIRGYYGDESGSMSGYGVSCSLQAPDDGDDQWDTGETLEINLTSGSPLPNSPGIHRIKLVMPNGATAEYTITV